MLKVLSTNAMRHCTKVPPEVTQRFKLFYRSERAASQLYPSTSQKCEEAMLKAETIVADASNFSNLQKWVSGEFTSITKYLERLIGTNHPMLETAKRCAYIGEGRMGSAQARGLITLLTAKATESLVDKSKTRRQGLELIRDQTSLAEMTEITYSAYMIHRGVMDLKLQGLEEKNWNDSETIDENFEIGIQTKHAKGLHYGNKVSILCGDFLLAYIMRGLGDLFSSKTVDLIATAITKFIEGEFLLIDDWRSVNYLLKDEARNLDRWEQRSFSSIGILQGNTCQAALVLAGIEERMQRKAYEFGKNVGLAWQAHTELQPFLEGTYEPVQLPEMPAYPSFDLNCIPVILFLRNSYYNSNYNLILSEINGTSSKKPSYKPGWEVNFEQHRHQDNVDYEILHRMVVKESFPIEQTYKIIEGYCREAIAQLDSFPKSQAKDILRNVCESLYQRP